MLYYIIYLLGIYSLLNWFSLISENYYCLASSVFFQNKSDIFVDIFTVRNADALLVAVLAL